MGILAGLHQLTGQLCRSVRAQLYLYLKCLLQFLQLVGGEDCPVPPFLLLLLPEDAGDVSTEARLVQLPCKRWLVELVLSVMVRGEQPPLPPSPLPPGASV